MKILYFSDTLFELERKLYTTVFVTEKSAEQLDLKKVGRVARSFDILSA